MGNKESEPEPPKIEPWMTKKFSKKKIKVMLVGDVGVGKTSYLVELTEYELERVYAIPNSTSFHFKYFSDTIIALEEVEYKVEIGESIIPISLHDTMNTEDYKFDLSLRKQFYTNINILIIMFDVSERKSFENVKGKWMKEAKENFFGSTRHIVLVGTKIELRDDEELRKCFLKEKNIKEENEGDQIKYFVTKEEAMECVRNEKIQYYYEVSSTRGIFVKDLMKEVARHYIAHTCKPSR